MVQWAVQQAAQQRGGTRATSAMEEGGEGRVSEQAHESVSDMDPETEKREAQKPTETATHAHLYHLAADQGSFLTSCRKEAYSRRILTDEGWRCSTTLLVSGHYQDA